VEKTQRKKRHLQAELKIRAFIAVETRKNNRLKEWVQQHLPELLAGEHIATPEPEELKR